MTNKEKIEQEFEKFLNEVVQISKQDFRRFLNNDPHSVFDIMSPKGVKFSKKKKINWKEFYYVEKGIFNHVIAKHNEDSTITFVILKNIPGRMEGFILNF
ncbi:hypothetical protein HOD29_02815 [archaeon]|jgi:hypothetical protein|nr:hypothetical protein [archaeon]